MVGVLTFCVYDFVILARICAPRSLLPALLIPVSFGFDYNCWIFAFRVSTTLAFSLKLSNSFGSCWSAGSPLIAFKAASSMIFNQLSTISVETTGQNVNFSKSSHIYLWLWWVTNWTLISFLCARWELESWSSFSVLHRLSPSAVDRSRSHCYHVSVGCIEIKEK